jgi:hypothetical protein
MILRLLSSRIKLYPDMVSPLAHIGGALKSRLAFMRMWDNSIQIYLEYRQQDNTLQTVQIPIPLTLKLNTSNITTPTNQSVLHTSRSGEVDISLRKHDTRQTHTMLGAGTTTLISTHSESTMERNGERRKELAHDDVPNEESGLAVMADL